MLKKSHFTFAIFQAGFLAAVPYAVMSVTAQFGGQFADWLRGKLNCSTTVVRKVFNGVGKSSKSPAFNTDLVINDGSNERPGQLVEWLARLT
jgi:hypothetical protein